MAALDGPGRAVRRIGLLGGSFNPAHEGHRALSLEAVRRLRLDGIWWLVAPQNPLKPVIGMAPLDRRLAQAARMAAHPRITVTAVERDLGTRYTVETLAALRRRFPHTRFVWLMGADNLAQMPRWRRWTQIFALVPVAVFARPTYCQTALAGPAAHRFRRSRRPESSAAHLADRAPPAWSFIRMRLHPASATAIRAGQGWP